MLYVYIYIYIRTYVRTYIHNVSSGCAMSGLIADSRTMIDKARVEAQVSENYIIQALKARYGNPYNGR